MALGNAGLGGSTPQMNRLPEVAGSKALFHSVRDIAIILDKTAKAGYGVIKQGTLCGVNSVDGKLVPYPTTDPTHSLTSGRAFIVTDLVNATKLVYVTVADSYKFAVGDSLIIDRNNATAQDPLDLGAITAIDRTTAVNRATITVTTNITGANHTVANSASCYVKTDASTPWTKVIYVVDQDIDTGTGSDAKGANTSVVLSNAALYKFALTNYDAAALADLGGVVDGRLVILK